jgi:uncharacterized protein
VPSLLFVAFGLPIGFLIGLTGVGGVLLAPALTHLLCRDVHEAVALSLASFIAAGLVAVVLRQRAGAAARTGPGDWKLLVAIVPGAALGAVVTQILPGEALSLLISAAVATAGVLSLAGGPERRGGGDLRDRALIAIGFAAGCLSAMSATGGPLVLLPLLLWRGTDIRHALGLARAAQLPVAASATLANSIAGTLDIRVAAILGVALVAGMLGGIAFSRRIAAARLHRGVSWCLLLVGVALCAVDTWRIVRAL